MAHRNTAQRERIRRALRKSESACHICGRPIDYTLRSPDPMSFEADHVIPLARGGADDLNNARASHRDCNNRKRARLIAPIVRRSGALD